MATFKTIWVFSQTDHGWTETHYRDATDLDTAATFSDALINARMTMASPLTVLRKIRVSELGVLRKSFPVQFNRAGQSPTGNEGPDVASVTAVYSVGAPSVGLTSNMFIRGLSDSQVRRDPSSGQNLPGAALDSAARNFITKLAANAFVVYGLEKLTGIAPLKYFDVQSITIAADKTATLNVTGVIVLEGDRFVLTQMSPKDYPGLNGLITAISADAGHIKVRYTSRLAPATYDVAKGRVRPAIYTSGVIVPQLSPFNKFGTRDTGKNSLAGRGRKQAVRLRLA